MPKPGVPHSLPHLPAQVSVNDCVVKAVAMALAEVPAANAFWDAAKVPTALLPRFLWALWSPPGLCTCKARCEPLLCGEGQQPAALRR